jgi:hypothetical protein
MQNVQVILYYNNSMFNSIGSWNFSCFRGTTSRSWWSRHGRLRWNGWVSISPYVLEACKFQYFLVYFSIGGAVDVQDISDVFDAFFGGGGRMGGRSAGARKRNANAPTPGTYVCTIFYLPYQYIYGLLCTL